MQPDFCWNLPQAWEEPAVYGGLPPEFLEAALATGSAELG